MVDAFKVLRKDNPQKALDCIDQAIMRYTSKGNFRRAASHKENAGEMLEQDLNDRVRAMQYYRDAALWYEQDGAKA
jgi:hypothetical protein